MEQINLLTPFETLLTKLVEHDGSRIVWVYGAGYFLINDTTWAHFAETEGEPLSSVVVDQLIADQSLKLFGGSSRFRKTYTITESGREIVRQKAHFAPAEA